MKFHHLSEAKLKDSVVIGPDARQFMIVESFMSMNDAEKMLGLKMLLPNS